jgi:putative proteasome-type protease
MRSNATVGPPIDLLIYEKDSFNLRRRFCLQADDPYLLEIKTAWDSKLKEAFRDLKRYNWNDPSPVGTEEQG